MADYGDPALSRLDHMDGVGSRKMWFTGEPEPEPEIYERIREIFAEALELITGNRAQDYGDPNEMFERIAQRWGTTKREAAYKMADLKGARLATQPSHRDSALDAIAYIAFGLAFDES